MFLERTLLFTFAMHGLGMLGMVLFLLPGMPGGGTADDAERIRYIATHPWLWRLGWLPWQLTALSDLLLAVALVRTSWIPRLPAWIALVVTVAAIVPDQTGQACWITKGIALARTDPAAYLAYEARIFRWTAVWGATLYCVGALAWTWSFAAARTWTRTLTPLSAVLWPLFFASTLGPLLGMPPKLVAAGNALGFLLMQLWYVLVTEEVGRRLRPPEPRGRWAPWRHPRLALLDVLANSRFLRAWGELLPVAAMRSDVTDVVYVNYIVEAARVEPMVPPGLALDRLGPDGRFALFTFLTFRHGGFGPRLLGPLCRGLPSPIQTNWRLYVRDGSGRAGVWFLTTAISSTPHALGARLFAEGLPMHVLRSADVGPARLSLDPGDGSAPDAEARLRPAAVPSDGPWRACFPSWRDCLAYAVPQDRAFSAQPWRNRLARQEIELGILPDACEPLEGEVTSRAAREIAGDAVPFCFRVPRVAFLFSREEHDPLPSAG